MRTRPKALLATQRLALREFHPRDAENLYRLNRDPRVMRYIGNGSVGTRASAEVEVGYRLSPRMWGRGYATEGARALLRYGFDVLGLYRIVGLTHPENLASQRVLCKAGLREAGWGRYYDRDLRLFVAGS